MSLFKKIMIAFLLCSLHGLVYAQANIPIASCNDLKSISANMSGYYYLTQDVYCGTVHPIDGTFTGTLDGQGFTIFNLNIVNQDGRKSENTGIFRTIGQNAQVTNIRFFNTVLTAHRDTNRGVIAGVATGNVNVTDVVFEKLQILHHDVAPDKKKDLGGTGSVVGLATEGTIVLRRVMVAGPADGVLISQNAFAGGLVGIAEGNIIIEQSSVWALQAKGSKECYNPANECGYGGLVGLIGKFQPHNYDHPDNHVPALENGNSAIISQSSASGAIFSDKNIGGFVGMIKADRGVLIENSYSDIAILCRRYYPIGNECEVPSKFAGGVVGKAVESGHQKMIALGNVYVIGRNDNDIKNEPYREWDTHSAAIVGIDESASTRIINLPNTQSYYDRDSTKMSISGDMVSRGLTSNQMQSGYTADFSTWDPSVWTFIYGYYPILNETR